MKKGCYWIGSLLGERFSGRIDGIHRNSQYCETEVGRRPAGQCFQLARRWKITELVRQTASDDCEIVLKQGKRWGRKRKNNSQNRVAAVIGGMRHKRAPIVDVEYSISLLVYNRRPQVVG